MLFYMFMIRNIVGQTNLYIIEKMSCLEILPYILDTECSQNINLTNIQMDFCGKIISDVLSIFNRAWCTQLSRNVKSSPLICKCKTKEHVLNKIDQNMLLYFLKIYLVICEAYNKFGIKELCVDTNRIVQKVD